jgi:archaemetzincin
LYKFIIIPLVFILLIGSCSSKEKTAKSLEGNIDVDSSIYIVPIGDVDVNYLNALVPKLETRFTTDVHVALDKKMPVPENSFDYDRQQYVAMYILGDMYKKLKVPPNSKVLGVTDVDIATPTDTFSPGTDPAFVFGLYFDKGNMALISIRRMDPRYYVGGKPNNELTIQRIQKEAIHELGRLFGLDNVNDPGCVMFLPKNLKELDRKTDNFCLECKKAFEEIKQKEKSKK